MKIIYKIYNEDYLRTADLNQLEQDHEIYGEFNISFGSKYYLPYPTEETLGMNPELYSELLINHFSQLNLVARTFRENLGEYVAIHYIESPWIWLEFMRSIDTINISEIYYEEGNLGDIILFEEHHFIRSKKEKHISISVAELINEVDIKINLFIENLKVINPLLIKSRGVKSLLSDSGRRDFR